MPGVPAKGRTAPLVRRQDARCSNGWKAEIGKRERAVSQELGKTKSKQSEGLAETLELSLARSSCKAERGAPGVARPVTRGRRADAYLQAGH